MKPQDNYFIFYLRFLLIIVVFVNKLYKLVLKNKRVFLKMFCINLDATRTNLGHKTMRNCKDKLLPQPNMTLD